MQKTELHKSILAKLNPAQSIIFNDAVEAYKEVVAAIESTPATTRNHYGSYLRFATSAIEVFTLLCAGANKQGVMDAARINGVAQ